MRPNPHNYVKKIHRMLAEGKLRPGDLATLDVMHDPACDLYQQRGRCNCDPTITVRPGLQPPLDDPAKILFHSENLRQRPDNSNN